MDFFVFEIKRRKSAIRAQFHIIYQKHVKPFKFVNPKTRPLFKLYAPFERLCRKIFKFIDIMYPVLSALKEKRMLIYELIVCSCKSSTR